MKIIIEIGKEWIEWIAIGLPMIAAVAFIVYMQTGG